MPPILLLKQSTAQPERFSSSTNDNRASNKKTNSSKTYMQAISAKTSKRKADDNHVKMVIILQNTSVFMCDNTLYVNYSSLQPVPTKYSGIDTSSVAATVLNLKHTGKKTTEKNIVRSASGTSSQRPSSKQAVPKSKKSSHNLSSCKPVIWSKMVNMI